MSVRIEIELTSSAPDGSWTWRAAGAREPRGVLDGTILPSGSSVGDQLRVETEHDLDGIRVLSVVPAKEKSGRSDLLELLPTEERFEPVVQHRAPGGGRSDGPRRPRRDRDGDRGERRDGDRRDRRDRGPRDDRGGQRDGGEGGGPRRDGDDRRRQRPHFTPPPEVPQRPKPKRLRPGKQHRADVLAATPEEQRPVAELTLQGMAAVRQRLREDNVRLKAEGKPEMPEAAVMRMAEELLPKLRVADWLDRAEAAQRQLEHLDLRDLRSVVASSDDPLVARDEATREIAAALKAALVTKQEEELTLWLGDVEVALDVGRVVRALRLSSQPPKAGVPFPGSLATRLAEAATASLQPTDGPDRWSAVLEAVAFSPVRTLVAPTAAPEARSDELLATVKRLGPLLPQVAALFGIEIAPNAPTPKPLRPTPRRDAPKKQAPKPTRPPAPRGDAPAATEDAPVDDAPAAPDDVPADEAPVQETPAPADDAPSEDAPAANLSPADDAPAEETPAPADDAPSEDAPAAADLSPAEDVPVEETPALADDAPGADAPAAPDDAPSEDAPAAADDAPAEETPAAAERVPTEAAPAATEPEPVEETAAPADEPEQPPSA